MVQHYVVLSVLGTGAGARTVGRLDMRFIWRKEAFTRSEFIRKYRCVCLILSITRGIILLISSPPTLVGQFWYQLRWQQLSTLVPPSSHLLEIEYRTETLGCPSFFFGCLFFWVHKILMTLLVFTKNINNYRLKNCNLGSEPSVHSLTWPRDSLKNRCTDLSRTRST